MELPQGRPPRLQIGEGIVVGNRARVREQPLVGDAAQSRIAVLQGLQVGVSQRGGELRGGAMRLHQLAQRGWIVGDGAERAPDADSQTGAQLVAFAAGQKAQPKGAFECESGEAVSTVRTAGGGLTPRCDRVQFGADGHQRRLVGTQQHVDAAGRAS